MLRSEKVAQDLEISDDRNHFQIMKMSLRSKNSPPIDDGDDHDQVLSDDRKLKLKSLYNCES